MQLTDRDLEVFKALNKLRFLNIETIQKLCKFPTYKKCAERMAILYNNGYLKFHQFSIMSKRDYFLTQKGLNRICPAERRISNSGRSYIYRKKPPKFSLANYRHENIVSKVLVNILENNSELTIDDFLTDREMQSFSWEERMTFKHCCDLHCEKYRVKIEIELAKKDKKDIARNMAINNNTYVQLWITEPNDTYNRLVKEKEKYHDFYIIIMKLEEFENKPVILSELYDELLKRNTNILREIQELEELKKKKVEQLKLDNI